MIKKVLNDTVLAKGLDSLNQRWKYEKEYEEWSEYEARMRIGCKKHELSFLKGTKRPFGFIAEISKGKVHFYIRIKGDQLSFNAKLL